MDRREIIHAVVTVLLTIASGAITYTLANPDAKPLAIVAALIPLVTNQLDALFRPEVPPTPPVPPAPAAAVAQP